MTTRERMQSGKLYFCTDEEIAKEQLECLEILYDYNHTRPSESQKREQILKNLLAEIGENCYIEPPLHANWGKYTHFGNNVYANFNLTLVGKNVWIGAGAIVLPGVTIGDHSVIGAGSVVTKDIPPNVVAVGNPCRVLREINDRDKEYYYKDLKIDL